MSANAYVTSALLPALRIGAMLAMLAVAAVIAAAALGLVPDRLALQLAERTRTVDLLAYTARQFAQADDEPALESLLAHLVDSGIARGVYAQREDGSLLTVHGAVDLTRATRPADPDFAVIELVTPRGAWGRLGVAFPPLAGLLPPALAHPLLGLSVFVGLICLPAFTLYLRRVLTTQDPTSVMPERVRTVMNALVEGVVLLDARQRIVHSNWAFARNFDTPADEMRGRSLSAFEWRYLRAERPDEPLPWDLALQTGKTQIDRSIVLTTATHGRRIYSVNVTPMFDSKRQPRGALATFDDQTLVVEKNAALRKALATLDRQRNEIAKQNEELKGLATRDSLTGCLNRRAFLEIFEAELLAAQKRGYGLACLMCDIDAFKLINDTHGHSTGDRVIEQAARLLQMAVRENDHICRYGGEEFCVLLPGLSSSEAMNIAERMRATIEAQMTTLVRLPDIPVVTASFGITDLQRGAQTLSELIDQADSALYRSKETGRNRVTVFTATGGRIRHLPDVRSRS